MSTANLHRLFNPKTVAVIGASEKKGTVGYLIMKNLVEKGFNGKIIPINPGYKQIMGQKAFSRIEDVDSAIDMAVIATPIRTVPEILESCGAADLAGVVIISSGGKEIGLIGRKMEEQILHTAKKYNLRIIGPNCLGFVNTASSLNASFAHLAPLPGKIAFLSQSGAVCTSVLDISHRNNVGFSHFVSLGSMLDVDFADMIDYLGSLSSVGSIVMYMENITHIRNFMSAARAVSRVKPIFVLKSGRSRAGAMAAASHTGAIAGEDALYDAAFARAGILRVNEFEELFDCTEFLAKQRRPNGPSLTIITNAGGPGVMAADALASHGIEPSQLSVETLEQLGRILPENWNRGNPIDIFGDSGREIFLKTARICANAPESDALLLICSPVGTMDILGLARSLADEIKTFPCPVLTAWIGGINVESSRKVFNDAGIVTYDSAERAVRAFKNLYQYGKNIEMLHEIPVRTDIKLVINRPKARQIISEALSSKEKSLTETTAKELLKSYGIPFNQKMQPKADYELIIGAKKDNQFGPVILFGMGGILTEVYKDTSMGLPPLNRSLARQMIEKTKISKVLNGFRNLPKVNMAILEEFLIRVGRLVTDFPEIQALDINPLMVKDGEITAVDARVLIGPATVETPRHLIISSYPWQYETKLQSVDGHGIFIRPIRPSDADLLIDHFYSLSQRSVYMRFFSPMKKLSKEMLIRLTQIDYDREIALVALIGTDKDRKIIGVCRVMDYPDGNQGEFAMAITDGWQGKGIGVALLQQCLKASWDKGLKHVKGIVLAENTQMLKLGRKLGFSRNRTPEGTEYELIIERNELNAVEN